LLPTRTDFNWHAKWSATRCLASVQADEHAAKCGALKNGNSYAVSILPLVVVPEQAGTPILANAGIETAASTSQPGGNMEGKEVRFGVVQSSLFALATFTTGSVNSMHDSFTPLGGMGTFIGMFLQCVFGGKGVGFLAALVYGIIGVFIAGLMVGRTLEFLGKKIEKPEIVLVSLALLIHPLVMRQIPPGALL
jgi:K+-transporting ATPase ATPase A chain